MINQTCRDLDSSVAENGCYFMAILFHGSQLTGESFSPVEILAFKEQSVTQGFLRENCYVLDGDGIFALIGVVTRYTKRHEPANYRAGIDQLEIQYWRYKTDGHFVAARDGMIIYDPSGFNSYVVRNGTLRSKRILNIL